MTANRTLRRSLRDSRVRPAVRAAIAVGVSVTALAAGSVPAWATTTDPYSATPYGYDVSYPQCPGTSVPAAPPNTTYTFAIVGVGGGRPFTSNNCAGTEVAAATSDLNITNVALYFNTGYAGAYRRNINSTCANDAIGDPYSVFYGIKGHALSVDQTAWEIGCSEALYAQTNPPIKAPTMWWADVETGNSWSTNISLNDFTIDGLSYAMQASGVLGGFYSYTTAWNKIAGAKGSLENSARDGGWGG